MLIKEKERLRTIPKLRLWHEQYKMLFCFKREISKKLPWNFTKECDWTHLLFSWKGNSVV